MSLDHTIRIHQTQKAYCMRPTEIYLTSNNLWCGIKACIAYVTILYNLYFYTNNKKKMKK